MVIQNPWEAAKQLSPDARKALTLSLIIGNLMSFTRTRRLFYFFVSILFFALKCLGAVER